MENKTKYCKIRKGELSWRAGPLGEWGMWHPLAPAMRRPFVQRGPLSTASLLFTDINQWETTRNCSTKAVGIMASLHVSIFFCLLRLLTAYSMWLTSNMELITDCICRSHRRTISDDTARQWTSVSHTTLHNEPKIEMRKKEAKVEYRISKGKTPK
jgi:hypothetical protein